MRSISIDNHTHAFHLTSPLPSLKLRHDIASFSLKDFLNAQTIGTNCQSDWLIQLDITVLLFYYFGGSYRCIQATHTCSERAQNGH